MDQDINSSGRKTIFSGLANNSNSFLKKFYTNKLQPMFKKKAFWVGVVITVIVIALLYGLHKASYDSGYKAGLEEGKKSSSLSNSFGNLQNPFQLASGTVADINSDRITVDTSRGQKQTVKIDDQTQVTKKTVKLNIDSIKKGTKVSVFTKGDSDDLTATRIVIRD